MEVTAGANAQIVESLVDEAEREYGIGHTDAERLVSEAVEVHVSPQRTPRDVAALYARVTIEAALSGEQWARRILPRIRKGL